MNLVVGEGEAQLRSGRHEIFLPYPSAVSLSSRRPRERGAGDRSGIGGIGHVRKARLTINGLQHGG